MLYLEVALPRCKQVATRLARVSALLASFSKASMSCCSASSHRPIRMLHTALPFSRRVCTAKQSPCSSYANNNNNNNNNDNNNNNKEEGPRNVGHGVIIPCAICWLQCGHYGSLQANSMASAQCFAHSSKSEQCNYSVLFTSAIQLCLRAVCICNFAVLQASLQW